MSVLEQGKYEGCYLCFPRYRIAVDMREGDVLLANVHEWHGNTELTLEEGAERISCVFYYRREMVHCGSAEEELGRANRSASISLGIGEEKRMSFRRIAKRLGRSEHSVITKYWRMSVGYKYGRKGGAYAGGNTNTD